jgi:hypothetical protein
MNLVLTHEQKIECRALANKDCFIKSEIIQKQKEVEALIEKNEEHSKRIREWWLKNIHESLFNYNEFLITASEIDLPIIKPTHAFVYFSDEKPKESAKYFWETKNGCTGCDYFDADSGEFYFPEGYPSNHDEHLRWLKEV